MKFWKLYAFFIILDIFANKLALKRLGDNKIEQK